MSGTAGSAADPAAIGDELRWLRGQVRADRRATAAPLLVFGTLILGYAAAVALAATRGAAASHLTLMLYWPLGSALGLLVLWGYGRRLAARHGVGEGRRSYRPIALGYIVSLPLVVILLLPVLLVGVFAPMVWPAAVLAAAAVRQRNSALRTVAVGLAGFGVVEAALALVVGGTGWGWAVLVAHAAIGAALVIGAGVSLRRGRTA